MDLQLEAKSRSVDTAIIYPFKSLFWKKQNGAGSMTIDIIKYHLICMKHLKETAFRSKLIW